MAVQPARRGGDEDASPGLMLDTMRRFGMPMQPAGRKACFDGIRPLAEPFSTGAAWTTTSIPTAWTSRAAKLAEAGPSRHLRGFWRSCAASRFPYFRFALNQSIAHKGYFDEHPLRDRALLDYLRAPGRRLHRPASSEVEAADDVDFDTFLESYLAFRTTAGGETTSEADELPRALPHRQPGLPVRTTTGRRIQAARRCWPAASSAISSRGGSPTRCPGLPWRWACACTGASTPTATRIRTFASSCERFPTRTPPRRADPGGHSYAITC